jgi:nucleotide-binding universal stress UspA family protein
LSSSNEVVNLLKMICTGAWPVLEPGGIVTMALNLDNRIPGSVHVVHPTDLTLLSEMAFAHALALALAYKGHFLIVHAADPGATHDPDWTEFPGVRSMLGRWGLITRDASRRAIAEQLDIRVAKELIPGADPVEALKHFLKEEGCDLLVLATHAREGLLRLLHGSIAEELARRTNTPALFLPHEGQGFIDAGTGVARLRNILIPVDRATPSHDAITLAFSLGDALECRDALVHLLHIGPAEQAPTVTVKIEQEPRLRRISIPGSVVRGIVEVAAQVEADLIVMATHGHDGMLDEFRGSTTEQVLRQAGRAVLAAPVL